MLTLGARLFCNGEAFDAAPALERLADRRRGLVPAAHAGLVYGWYLQGAVHLERAT
jgi:hypothetical protein